MSRNAPAWSIAAIMAALLVAGCGRPEVAQGINDPYEAQNRRFHESTKRTDTRLIRPASQAYGETVPDSFRIGVSNFSSNLAVPGTVLNDLLQFNLGDAVHNVARFAVNTTVGIGGLFNPAQAMGLEERESDFGETLYVWGVAEGPYRDLPLIGPATTRDAVGQVVDVFINPLNYVVPTPERYVGTAASVGDALGERYRFGDTIDAILYESTDSYAQSRLFYLENRRFELGSGGGDGYVDPYDSLPDPYADPSDPVGVLPDPYDPVAE